MVLVANVEGKREKWARKFGVASNQRPLTGVARARG